MLAKIFAAQLFQLAKQIEEQTEDGEVDFVVEVDGIEYADLSDIEVDFYGEVAATIKLSLTT